MIVPDEITEPVIALKDQYFDLRGLSAYSSMAISTLRDHVRQGKLPCFKCKGKILIKRSEFDQWLETFRVNKRKDLTRLVDETVAQLKKSKKQ